MSVFMFSDLVTPILFFHIPFPIIKHWRFEVIPSSHTPLPIIKHWRFDARMHLP